jgi:hypothetical protein
MRSASRSWLALGISVLFTACANIGPPQPPSLQLPKPPSDLRASRKGNQVTLSWTIPTLTTDRQRVRSFGPALICRGLQPVLTECGNPVGEAPPPPLKIASATKISRKQAAKQKTSESYIDSLPGAMLSDDPSSYVTYAVEVLNADRRAGGLSNQLRVPLIRTLPAPSDFHAQVTSRGVVLSWSGQVPASIPDGVRYVYRVYRREEGTLQPVFAGEVSVSSDRNYSLTDANIEWQKTYEYHVEAFTIIAARSQPEIEVPGDDSAEIKVFANDIFPPAVPTGLQAVASGPGQPPFIDLIWAPDTDADLAGYNVYRREAGGEPVKLNSAPLAAPAYRDTHVTGGKTYYYSVSAVDLRGNESARSEEASEHVP